MKIEVMEKIRKARHAYECGIYKIQNEVSGKMYVGSSSQLSRREYLHLRELRLGKHFNEPLQRAWNRYGEESLVFTLLEEVSSPSKLLEREQAYLDTLPKSLRYNTCSRANSRLGTTCSPETRAKISKANKGRPAWNKGITHTEATRKKLRETHLGKMHSPEALKNVQAANKRTHRGKTLSDETRAKISAAKQGHPVSDETREKLREAWVERRKRGVSAKTREKLSRSGKKYRAKRGR